MKKGIGVVAIVLLLTIVLVVWFRGTPVGAAAHSNQPNRPSTEVAVGLTTGLESGEYPVEPAALGLDDQQDSGRVRLITTSGDAEVRVVPDEVVLTLGVETWNESLETAKRQNDERVKQVLTLAQVYEIPAKYVQTDFLSVEPRYHDNYEKREFVGFFVRKTIVVTLRDISRFEAFLTAALQNGVNYVHGIEFRTTELRRYRDQARTLAIRAAREKASALARELGQQIGEPYTIQEEPSGWRSWYGAWWGSYWGGGMAQNVVQNVGEGSWSGDGSIALGQITVQARVSVTFELE